MEKLTKSALQTLVQQTASPTVTIYIPMHTTASPPHVAENQIRFKNLLHQAADQLRQDHRDGELAERLEQVITEKHDDMGFWEQQTPGLLLCATPESITFYQLPIDTEEYIAIDRHFHLAPLMGIVQDAREFLLLVLAQHQPKLFIGSLFGLEPYDIKLPESPKTALNIDETNQKSENQGTTTGPSSKGTAGSVSSGRGWFNGRGGARNPQEQDRLKFFRMIDQNISEATNKSLPLIVAGTDSEVAEYREISKYPRLLETSIAGNHVHQDTEQLFRRAKQILRDEIITPDHQAAVEDYLQTTGHSPERASHDAKSIAKAALEGRVDTLLARLTRRTADTVQDSEKEVPRISFPDKVTSKHLNDVALSVWQTSGEIYNLLPDEMPNGTLLAAKLRY
jgi:hypothetical protein